MIFLSANPVDVHRIIMDMRNTKFVGDDKILGKLLKYVAIQLSEPITYIINLCLSTGIVLEKLKMFCMRQYG